MKASYLILRLHRAADRLELAIGKRTQLTQDIRFAAEELARLTRKPAQKSHQDGSS
jgi:hypothetical protein